MALPERSSRPLKAHAPRGSWLPWIVLVWLTGGGCATSNPLLEQDDGSARNVEDRLRTRMQYAVFNAEGEDTANRYMSTVVVKSPDSPYLCSGVLLHPHLVLTAAHCVCAPREGQRLIDSTSCSKSASVTAHVYVEREGAYGVRSRSSRGQVVPHKKFKGRFGEHNAVMESTSDLAVIFLEEPMLGVALDFRLSETDLQIRNTLTVVGYGLDKPSGGGSGRRLFGRNEVTGMALSNLTDKDDNDVVFLFEKPGAQAAPGDSGGPCFRESEQGRWLVGIVSQARGDGRGSRFTSLYPHLRWLKAQMERAEQLRRTRTL